MDVRSYSDAVQYLADGKDKNERPLANNTRLIRRSDDDIAVRLHATDVVTYHRNGTATLNSGGWRTPTTKDRINRFAPVGVNIRSDRGKWWLYEYMPALSTNFKDSLFYDEMVVDEFGRAKHPKSLDPVVTRREAAIRKRVYDYVNEYVKRFKKGMPLPGPGDCWFCLFFDQNGPNSDTDHIRSHISKKERYYVPSLLINALRAKGMSNDGIAIVVKGREDGTMGGEYALTDTVRRALRKYILQRLIPENVTR